MIFGILFSCLSRGPDDQGLSCGPCVIIVRESPAGGGSQRFKSEEKGDEGHCRRVMWGHCWWREQAIGPDRKIDRGHVAPGSRAGAGLGAPLEKSVGQGGGAYQPDLGRRDRGVVRAGSGGFGYGGARRTSAGGLSSRKPS